MKTYSLFALLLIAAATHSQGQINGAVGSANLPTPTPWTVVSRGANHSLWQRQTYEQGPNGTIITNIHSYVQVSTGLNWRDNGEWVSSSDKISVSADGAIAYETNCQSKVYYPGNIDNGVVKVVTPDGQIVESQPIGLALSDGSNSVLLAEVTNSTGAILPSGTSVIYKNAFSGLSADLLYKNTLSGMEQDVVLRQQPPDPAALGLDPAKTRLQMLTEFVSAPQPEVSATTVQTAAGELEDDQLSFGAMRMGQGKAFMLGTNSPSLGVEKHWMTLNGRQFLIEEVPMVSISNAMRSLLPFTASRSQGHVTLAKKSEIGNRKSEMNLMLPPRRPVLASPKTRFLAQAASPDKGFVLDYQTINSSQTNFAFTNCTYYVSGNVYLYGTTTIEGGTVIKFANSPVSLTCYGPIQCQTASYRPCVFTAIDDNSAGETISGSTGNPTGYYGEFGLFVENAPVALHNLAFRYLAYGLGVESTGQSNIFRDIQFVDDESAFASYSATNDLGNVLMANVGSNGFYEESSSISVENLTMANATNLWTDGLSPSTLAVTNSLLFSIGNLGDAFDGAYNVTNNDASGVFQKVGGGDYYLADDSLYRNAGTTNIPSDLLADLGAETTYPPIVYSNATISTELTLGPQAQRDTDLPDEGYHYDPLDYAFGGTTVNSNLTFEPGTAVAWFRTSSGWYHAGYGIVMANQQIATFQGTATQPVWWVRSNTVQEQGGNGPWLGNYGPGGLVGQDTGSISLSPEAHLFFTHCAVLTQGGGQRNFFRDDSGYLIVRANHSEFYGGGLGVYVESCYLTNCFMDRVNVDQVTGWPGNEFTMRNCTMHGGWLLLQPYSTPIPISVRDCAFDQTWINITSDATNSAYADYDYNAYTNTTDPFPIGGAHDVVVTNFNWQSGWLGGYYLPPDSPLINHGDVTANQVGLYQFTTQTNGIREADTVVDIGYHYVANGTGGIDTVWVEDALPAGATGYSDGGDAWTWISSSPTPYSGLLASQSSIGSYEHQHYFLNATDTLTVNTNDTLIAYVYLDPGNPPSEIMLQWNDNGSWEHRAYWGANDIGWGVDGTVSRYYMGSLPATGKWVRLEVPASAVGLEGQTLNGLALTLYGGRATWDYIGKNGGNYSYDTDGDGIPDYLEDSNGDGIFDTGDLSDWLTYNSKNGLTGVDGLIVFTPLK